jgi:hypothetical protein
MASDDWQMDQCKHDSRIAKKQALVIDGYLQLPRVQLIAVQRHIWWLNAQKHSSLLHKFHKISKRSWNTSCVCFLFRCLNSLVMLQWAQCLRSYMN